MVANATNAVLPSVTHRGPRARDQAHAGQACRTVDTALAASELFRLDSREAREVLDEVVQRVGSWRHVAARHGLTPSEVARMEPAYSATVP